ncbi:MAG: L-histidine N(alpha)-methyltransferase [Acidimicrobiales bacterium]
MPSLSAITIDVHLADGDLQAALERDVRDGLRRYPKSIPPTWFYDEEGSRLFEEITRLPEYYPTRAERALLERHSDEIASFSDADVLVELGAGSCDKTRILLDAMAELDSLRRYVPFDVSAEFLEDAATGLSREYGGLQVHAVIGDFLRHLDRIPSTGRRLVAFLGGTIGNLVPAQRKRFFRALRATMSPVDRLLVGADLVKDSSRIVAAYDDSAGVTAKFNRNVLRVLNRSLDADFAPERFAHVVRWNAREEWIEMHLRALAPQTVTVGALGLIVRFDEDEELLTEVSAKFTPHRLAAELRQAGFRIDHQWGAEEGEFLLTLAAPRD